MKKKLLIIQSFVMVFVTILMLTVVSFAWFVSNSKNDLGGFNVSVVGMANIEYKFYQKNGDVWSAIPFDPKNGEAFIKDQTMIPNVPIWRRIDITNLSSSPIKVAIDFTGITCKIDNTQVLTTPKQDLIDYFYVQPLAVEFALPEPAETSLTFTNKFLTNILSTPPTATSFTLISDVSIGLATTAKPNDNKKSVYYRFLLDKKYTGLGLTTFDITASGIQFRADLQ